MVKTIHPVYGYQLDSSTENLKVGRRNEYRFWIRGTNKQNESTQ